MYALEEEEGGGGGGRRGVGGGIEGGGEEEKAVATAPITFTTTAAADPSKKRMLVSSLCTKTFSTTCQCPCLIHFHPQKFCSFMSTTVLVDNILVFQIHYYMTKKLSVSKRV